ncbi:hypothetical protein Zm00014a_002274 [Zea mays]|uniref:DUF4408 domain-containing protein n=1 Tax=Zea mays TaxID=4577 RepID=A0A3L6FTF0_MAIZE|nr:hypothetical protein Zm00014a_002274 [Zea mays]
MATPWWWPSLLPAWLSSSALWFLVANAVVAAVAILSRRPPLPLPSPRRRRRSSGAAAALTRRASSALLQRLRSFSIFAVPSACFNTTTPFPHPDAAQGTETEAPARTPASPLSSLGRAPAADADEEDGEPGGMSMDEAYALALEARRRPDREREEAPRPRRSEVDAKPEEFIRGFEDDQRQQRLNSIFNYTQMLKQRAAAARRQRQPDAPPDQL